MKEIVSHLVGTTLIEIVDRDNPQEDNGCSHGRKEDKISHVSLEETLDSTREQYVSEIDASCESSSFSIELEILKKIFI